MRSFRHIYVKASVYLFELANNKIFARAVRMTARRTVLCRGALPGAFDFAQAPESKAIRNPKQEIRNPPKIAKLGDWSCLQFMPSMTFKQLPRTFLIVTFALCSSPAFSQLPVMQFETITTRDGLPTTTVLSAVQDRSGFMWFGTRLCPIRYDGATFRVFNKPETNLVSGIAVDHENNIWFASDPNGIGKIGARDLELRQPLTDVDEKETGYFYVDRHNRGWYSDFHGVNRVDLKTHSRKHYPLRQTTYLWAKASFTEDPSGTLWVVGRDNGLFRYDPVQDRLICEWGPDSEDPSRREDVVLSRACADSNGNLWIATISHGLIKWDPRSRTAQKYYSGRDNPSMFSVATGVDENGKPILWIGHQDGLGVFRPEQEKFYYFSNIFPVDFEVHDISRNVSDGVVWVCTSEGIVKYHPKSNFFQTISLPPDISGPSVAVSAVIQDRFAAGEVYYLGLSHTGMVRWERSANAFTLIAYPGGAEAETNWMIQRDDNTIWIGTSRWDQKRPGIFVYDLIKQKFVTNPISELANKAFSIPFFKYASAYGKDKFLIGNSDEGVVLFKNDRDITPWSDERQKELLKDNNMVTDVLVTKDSKVLLGTVGGVVYADENHRNFSSMDINIPDSIPWRAVNTLFEDRNGNIWAARWGCLTQTSPDGKLMNVFTTADGFHDQECSGIVEDASGNIWMGNFEGLYCINPLTRRVIRFTVSDGLISNNTRKRLFMSNDKEHLFVGHKNGFNVVEVSKQLNTTQAPLLAVSSFKVHEKIKDVDLSKAITLKREENAFSVDFIALNYRKEEDNQYAYYLEGFDKDWNYSGTSHLAYYTNVGPGHYTLHARAGDAFGNWSEQTLKMSIHVIPAFYETWWFRCVTLAAIISILYAAYRFRVNQLLRLQRVRNRISADLHDEFGSSLSSISIMGTLAQKGLSEQHPATQFVDRMVEEARHMSGSLDDIIWNISAKNDSLDSMITRMRRYASEVFEAKKILYSMVMPERIEEVTLTMEQRRDLYLIFKESVNNIAKHSHCARASVAVAVVQKDLVMKIEDDGAGFDPARETNRNGLVNLRERARNLNGRVVIESAPGKGTSIKLAFPLRAHHPKGLLKE